MTSSPATLLGAAFLVAVLLSLIVKCWLLFRQLRHVRQHRDRVPSAFSARITLADHQKAADYTIAKTAAAFAPLFAETTLLLLLTLAGGLQWIQEIVSSLTPGLSAGVALIVTVTLAYALIDLPFSLHRQFVVEKRYGFNHMTLKLYFADFAKNLAISTAIGLPLLYAVLALMDTMGKHWWWQVWLLWTSFNLVLLWAYPAVIAPLFNRFTPLADAELANRITALLTRCGFQSNGLFVMDGSKRSAHGNAYFTGLGSNKRIVFFDTLIKRLDPDEIEAVLAHELGHFKHRHVLYRMLMMFGGALVFLWTLAQLLDASWFYAGLGVATPSQAAALLLFFLALPPFLFPLAPLGSLLSRRQEYQADRYAATQTDARNLVSALVKLYQDNAATLTPDPVYSQFHDSHPPAALRIRALEALQESST